MGGDVFMRKYYVKFDWGNKLLIAPVKLDIVFAHEHIPQDPQRTIWCWNIDASQGKQTHAARLDDILALLKSVVLASDGEHHVRCISIAVDGVLAVDHWLGTHEGGKLCNLGFWACKQRCTRVDDGRFSGGHGLAIDLEVVQGNAPVVLGLQRNICEVAGIVGTVDTTDHEATRCVVTEVKRKHRLCEYTFVHKVVEWGLHTIDRNPVPSETKDTVELADAISEAEALGIF